MIHSLISKISLDLKQPSTIASTEHIAFQTTDNQMKIKSMMKSGTIRNRRFKANSVKQTFMVCYKQVKGSPDVLNLAGQGRK